MIRSMLFSTIFSAAIAELLDNAIDEVIIKDLFSHIQKETTPLFQIIGRLG